MKLLKIGNQLINIDLLESVNYNADDIKLSIAGEEYSFQGDEAQALKSWFEHYAFDLMGHHSLAVTRTLEGEEPLSVIHDQMRTFGLFRKPFELETSTY